MISLAECSKDRDRNLLVRGMARVSGQLLASPRLAPLSTKLKPKKMAELGSRHRCVHERLTGSAMPALQRGVS